MWLSGEEEDATSKEYLMPRFATICLQQGRNCVVFQDSKGFLSPQGTPEIKWNHEGSIEVLRTFLKGKSNLSTSIAYEEKTMGVCTCQEKVIGTAAVLSCTTKNA